MKVPANLSVGAASHTGRVRGANEDDYLLGSLPSPGPFLAAIADGMGGMAGGAEASRTALRAMGACVLDGGSKTPVAQLLREGFAAAGVRVHDASREVPALKDMGTTLSVLCLAGGQATIGHVGDTRIYRRRGGVLEQLTTDHAVRHPDNLLTRCIGVGHSTVEADFASFATQSGDRFVLVSDGVWGVLPAGAFARALERLPAQETADHLVAEALAMGGPDNATALVVDVGGAESGQPTERPLPREERADDRRSWPRPSSLRAPLWPWLVLVAGVGLLAHAALTWRGVDGGLAWFLRS
jgi:serine/threonine protein phosphatase PrpC